MAIVYSSPSSFQKSHVSPKFTQETLISPTYASPFENHSNFEVSNGYGMIDG
ncbi:predicted protein [Sclerotinia sclerotiorum 1980 UF-70]|uniref:Uncharacterized protein n=1 Tax=Sclerotinia sclerotiorum (strain ATCC 18683 / 1980 / Ss-1) TaxID=665079 RepID=A7ES46_SCLS1|nr:predicted protein [Sclerotinia sclerotiorum 1980 UF-70]EDN92288.1 predicted protein [Sclerotinia sclerotiorum 1980 UF-70]